jgi:diketogulonate reductase-like aldo/keto reductase
MALPAVKCRYMSLHVVAWPLAARHEAWREMVALQKEGTLRHIGISNFGTAEMRQLKAAFPDAPPVTLQSKFSPYHRVSTPLLQHSIHISCTSWRGRRGILPQRPWHDIVTAM